MNLAYDVFVNDPPPQDGFSRVAPGACLDLLRREAVARCRRERGVEVSEVYHCATGTACRFRDGEGVFQRVSGPAPGHASYSSFAAFSDPDGNSWLLQEITARLPGRIDAAAGTAFASAGDLAGALRRAEAAHGEHEKRTGQRDENWPDWYAAYMLAEQSGAELPT